jgi:hypothetical protein
VWFYELKYFLVTAEENLKLMNKVGELKDVIEDEDREEIAQDRDETGIEKM